MIDDRDAQELMKMQEQDSQVFENIITRIYTAVLQPGDTCLDGGAANGLHTLPMARLVGADGKVLSFEPVPSSARNLERVLQEKKLHHVQVIQKALYHEARTVQFRVVTNAVSRSGIAETSYPFEPDIKEKAVETILIDEVLAGVSTWRFCKLDIEGAEFRALQGGRRAITKHEPFLVFERSVAAAEWYQYTPVEFFDFFRELGYRTFDLFGRELALRDWGVLGRPWYALGVRIGSDDEEFVHERLTSILLELRDSDPSRTAKFLEARAAGGPFIWAAPNPVPGGTGPGTTVVRWDSAASDGEVYISVNGDEERLFFRSAKGSRCAPWINAWGTYVFRLYAGLDRAELLDAVTVTRRKQ